MKWRLKHPVHFEQDIKKSTFLAQAVLLASENELSAHIKALSYPDARHNCWACRVGSFYRFDDADEPGGTAGRPILQVIEAQNMDYILVMVSRWFGGIKLGAGGLVRAYGGTAAACLRDAAKEEIIAFTEIVLICSFQAHALLRVRLASFAAHVEEEHFRADSVHICLSLPADNLPKFKAFYQDLTRGQGTIKVKEE